MRARRPLLTENEGIREVWPAFTDVMSTLALILFVIVLLAYVRNFVSAKRLEAYQRQITTSEQHLHTLEEDLGRTSREVAAAKAELDASQTTMRDQRGIIADSNRELETLRARLEGIAVLRLEVLNKLKQAIEVELSGSQPATGSIVRIGDNGNIVINESLVFEYNSYALKPEAKPVLDRLARALGTLLADPNVRDNIDAIVIQGHTDERGAEAFNRDLSGRRANAVLGYMFGANPVLPASYGSYFAASAYSKFRPINPAKTEEAYTQNRRIEIAVVPKDANVRKVIEEYTRSLDPALAPAPPTAP